MLNSDYRRLLPVKLPFLNRQIYMHSFDVERPRMADGFEDYMEIALDLIFGAGLYKGRVHMTVDEKLVKAGRSQRKPDPHVDGCYVPAKMVWGHEGGGVWAHDCNKIDVEAPLSWAATQRRPHTFKRMPVIVAASVAGCRAWRGDFNAEPTNTGNLSHIAPQLGAGEVLEPNYGYLLSPDCVHESMIMPVDTKRTFLRIALPTTFRF